MHHHHFAFVVSTVLILLGTLTSTASAVAIPGHWELVNHIYTPRDKFGLSCWGNEVLLFGGRLSSSTFANSLYRYNQSSGWREVFPISEPAPRFGMRLHRFTHADLGDVFYGFGGNIAKTVVVSDVIVYVSSLQEWRSIATNAVLWPSPRSKYASVQLDDTFVIFGGITERTMTDEVWSFNVSSSTWTLLHDGSSSTAPSARFDLCCAFVTTEKKSYCFGGTTADGDSNEVWAFDHNSRLWTHISLLSTGDTPAKRRLASCFAGDAVSLKTLSIYGGWDSAASSYNKDQAVFTINLATKVWSKVAQSTDLTNRDSQQMCQNDDGVYLLGGSAEGKGKMNDLWLMKPTDTQFVRISKLIKRPFARSGHSSVTIGSQMFILFGKDGTTSFNDVWSLNMTSNEWSSVKITSTTSPAARYGAAVVASGEIIIVHGGYTSSGGYSSELWTLDTVGGVWSTMTQNGKAPAARAFHRIGMLSDSSDDERGFFLFGGKTANDGYTNDTFLFSLEDQMWSEPTITGDYTRDISANPLLARRDHAIVADKASRSLLVFGGIGKDSTLKDRYRVTFENQNSNDGNDVIKIVKLSSDLPVGGNARNFLRSEAAVAGVGSHYIICGGAISSSFPTPIDYSCHQYDANDGTNTVMAQAPVAFVSGTAVYYKNKYIAFGGQYASEAVRRDVYLNHLQIFDFEAASVCTGSGAGTTDLLDTSCIHCSEGTINPTTAADGCTPVRKGAYALRAFDTPTDCLKGRFNSELGATSVQFCQVCPVNTYTNEQGQSACLNCTNGCRLGATSATDVQEPGSNVSIHTEQPNEYAPVPVPLWIYMILVAVVVCTVTGLSFTLLLADKGKQTVLSYYLSNEDQTELEELYHINCKNDPLGIKIMGLQKTLRQFGFGAVPSQLVEELFRQFNVDGSTHIDLDELKLIIVECHRKRLVAPSIGTKNYEENHAMYTQWAADQADYEQKMEASLAAKSASLGDAPDSLEVKEVEMPPFKRPDGLLATIGRAEFAQFDMFMDSHRIGRVGDSIKLQKTTFGGFITTAFYFLVLVLIAALILTFWFTNMFETRGVIPEVSLNRTINSNFDFRYTIYGVGANDKSNCVQSGVEDEVEGACHSENRLASGSLESGGTSSQQIYDFSDNSTMCVFSLENSTCTIIWKCISCHVDSLQTTYVDFATNPQFSAGQVDVILSTTSGILDPSDRHDEPSTANIQFVPDDDKSVFRGHPAGTVDIRLVPTYFETIKNSVDQSMIDESGYHVQVLRTSKAHEVNHDNFNQFFGTPMRVVLTPSDTILLVSRKPLQTLLQLITSILGSLSGLSGGLLVLVQQMDGHLQRGRNRQIMLKRKKWESDLRSDNLKQIRTDLSSSMMHQRRRSHAAQMDDLDLISGLTDHGVSAAEALLHLELVRVIINNPGVVETPVVPLAPMGASQSPKPAAVMQPITAFDDDDDSANGAANPLRSPANGTGNGGDAGAARTEMTAVYVVSNGDSHHNQHQNGSGDEEMDAVPAPGNMA